MEKKKLTTLQTLKHSPRHKSIRHSEHEMSAGKLSGTVNSETFEAQVNRETLSKVSADKLQINPPPRQKSIVRHSATCQLTNSKSTPPPRHKSIVRHSARCQLTNSKSTPPPRHKSIVRHSAKCQLTNFQAPPPPRLKSVVRHSKHEVSVDRLMHPVRNKSVRHSEHELSANKLSS